MRRTRKRKESLFLWRATATAKKFVPCFARAALIIIEISGLMWFAVGLLALPTVLKAETAPTGKDR